MSSEVCPFCGKTYKRLKSHLPHCKAAASSKTPPSKPEVTGSQKVSSSLLDTASSKSTLTETKTTQTLQRTARTPIKKTGKVSVDPPAPPLQTGDASYPSQSLSQKTIPPSSLTKKKKQKLSEQIKAAKKASSTSTLPLSPPPISSEPQKKSLRALTEARESKQAPTGSLEGTRPASEDLPSSSSPSVTGSPRFGTKIQAEAKSYPDSDLVKDSPQAMIASTVVKPRGEPKMKASKTKKVLQSGPTTKDTSLDPHLNERSARLQERDSSSLENQAEVADYTSNSTFLKPGTSGQTRITLQDVKATLGRPNNGRQPSRPSILSQIDTMEVLGSRTTPALPSKTQDSISASASALSHQIQVKSQVIRADPPPLKAGPGPTGILTLSPSPGQFSSPHTLRLLAQTPPAQVETLRADDGSRMEIRRPNMSDNGGIGSPSERSLGQVRLRELPEWFACRTPGHPRDVVQMVQRGWQWYYRRYIDVKKGGVGGVAMLLAGYCVLSYIWSFPHIKRDRWRKYH